MSAPEIQVHKVITELPRIAFKAKGNILFLNLAEIFAVQAESNYVSSRRTQLVATNTTSIWCASPLVPGGQAKALWFYSYPPLSRECFGCRANQTFIDRRVQAVFERWE